VGKGKRQPDEVPQLLEEKNRNNVPFTAPAEGLYLEKIYLSPESLTEEFGNDIKIHLKKSLENDWMSLTKALWNYKIINGIVLYHPTISPGNLLCY